MTVTRRFVVFGAPLALVACGGPEPVWAPDDAVARAVYRHDGPPRLTLFTMRKRSTGGGMHTGLMVNASQRVIFDPAGTFNGSNIPERNDVMFGVTPLVAQYYVSYHARETFYVHRQEVDVPAEVAEQALRLVMSNGAVAKTRCAVATGQILAQLPGFGYIRPGIFPGSLSDQFAQYPGVVSSEYYEDDSDDKTLAQAAYEALLKRQEAGQ